MFVSEYKKFKSNGASDDAFKYLVENTLVNPKYGQDKSGEITAMNFEKDFIADFLPSMVYTFMYETKTKETIGKASFIDYVPVLLCFTNRDGFISGINFNFLPNNIRAEFLDKIYNAYKEFYTDTLSDAITSLESVYNKEFASFLIDDTTRQAFLTLMDKQLDYPISSAYRRYNKSLIKNPRMIEFDNWKYIPHLVFKDAIRGAGLVEVQREIITNK